MKESTRVTVVACLCSCAWFSAQQAAAQQRGTHPQTTTDKIDFVRVRTLAERQAGGGELGPEELAYLTRAREEFERVDQPPRASIGLAPLTDMTADDRYRDFEGGLYPSGENDVPTRHADAAMKAALLVEPVNTRGEADPNGLVALISNGMSNTTQEFRVFKQFADVDQRKSPRLVIVDCAQGGMEAFMWAKRDDEAGMFGGNRSPWKVQDERLKQAGVSPNQVQVVWIKQTRGLPISLGEFPKHARTLSDNLAVTVTKLKQRFPNLRLAYFSSRIYAGYARTHLNPEPYAYESAFSVRWLIERQMNGDPELNHDERRGPVKAPVMLWGPYLWADGIHGRNQDDLIWNAEDFESDGTHPSTSGCRKVAVLLMKFFTSDPTSMPWFVQ